MEVRGHDCESARCNSRGSCCHKLAHEVGLSASPQLHTFRQEIAQTAPQDLARYDFIVSIDILRIRSALWQLRCRFCPKKLQDYSGLRRGRMGSINSTGRP